MPFALPILGAARAASRPFAPSGTFALRVSLLEQCPYRCAYCLPGSVTPPTARARWLGAEEHLRLARVFAAAGVEKVRFTGGEPLVRADVAEVIAAWRDAAPDVLRALTTNGQRLGARVAALHEAGLQRLTVHLDTLRPQRYRALMGDGDPAAILADAAWAQARFPEVKLNVVVQRDRNDDELLDFLRLSAETGIEVRFIELMDTGSARAYTRVALVTGAEIVARIAARAGATPVPRRRASDPAALYRTDAGVTFGVIASDTEPFCADCDRLRLTADGRLRGCLYEAGGVPVGDALKAGAGDAELAALVAGAIAGKRSHHPRVATGLAPFSMADVGG